MREPDQRELQFLALIARSMGVQLPGMAAPKQREVLGEAFFHLERLVTLMKEWQTDWSALRPSTGGFPNPDYDPSYLERIKTHPEEVFHPQVIEAENFLRTFRRK